MFTTLETSINEQQISILEALLKKYQPELCTQKQFYTALLFNNPLGPAEENTINRTNFTGFRYFLNVFFLPPWNFLLSPSRVYFLTHEIGYHGQFPEENWLKWRDPFKGFKVVSMILKRS